MSLSKTILHVDYWDKRKGSKERVSFQISGFEDYKAIEKSLRKNGYPDFLVENVEPMYNRNMQNLVES